MVLEVRLAPQVRVRIPQTHVNMVLEVGLDTKYEPVQKRPLEAMVLEVGLDTKYEPVQKRPLEAMVLEVGLEPTNSEEGRFTVSCDCHYAIPAATIIIAKSPKKSTKSIIKSVFCLRAV